MTPPARRAAASSCAICRKPFRAGEPREKAKSGKDCHGRCLTQARKAGAGNAKEPAKRPGAVPAPRAAREREWDTRAAVREFERNREAVTSGETYRSQKPSTWRRGGSPSSVGEVVTARATSRRRKP
ncbi:hypothetical protein [Streptomyces sp. NPDC001380]|uniref:hypothetical protein n=1 Tax=Streptomyces sp. NPDC001380 TaxID=3364566 RepID=UPI00367B909F